jgi:hypothetical protein
MLTLPIEAAPESRPESRVLIIGRSENVLSETVLARPVTSLAASVHDPS